MKRTIDELLKTQYWIIDILPVQVPKDSPGQYFAIERYYLEEPQLSQIKQKHINLILKLNCYKDISLDEWETINPLPEYIAEEMRKRYLCIMVENSMIVSEPDDMHMTFFNSDEQLLELIRTVASSEGLFVWKGIL